MLIFLYAFMKAMRLLWCAMQANFNILCVTNSPIFTGVFNAHFWVPGADRKSAKPCFQFKYYGYFCPL